MYDGAGREVADVIADVEAMEAHKGSWDAFHRKLARLVDPDDDAFGTRHAPGHERNLQQYTAFPTSAVQKFAANIEAGLTPEEETWFEVSTGEPDLDELDAVKRYRELLGERLRGALYRETSGFATQINPFYRSLGVYGTACMLLEARKEGGILARTIHLAQMTFAENHIGQIDRVGRRFQMSALNALRFFGRPGDDLSPKIAALAADPKSCHQKLDFLHFVRPNDAHEPGTSGYRGMKFAEYYVDLRHKSIIRRGGYHEQPYIVSRYVVAPGEVYGRSPAMIVLPDIKMLNEMMRTVIDSATEAVQPMILTSETDTAGLQLSAGSLIAGGLDMDGRPRFAPFRNEARLDIGLDMIERVQNIVDDAFLGVYFRTMLNNPQMTATQVMQIAQQQGQMTQPILRRQQSEFLGPLLRRTAGILSRQDRLPPMPDELQEHLRSDGGPLRLEYRGPWAQMAKIEQAVGVLRTFEGLAPIAQADPQAGQRMMQRFDMDEVAVIVAEANGMPMRAIRTKDQMAAQDEQGDQQQQIQQLLAAAPIASSAAKDMSQAAATAASIPSPDALLL